MTRDGGRTEAWWRWAAEVVWLPTAAEMAELDRRATSSGAIPERALIENAGREIARCVHERWPTGRVVALAGSGHNGADALVALRCLSARGREVDAVLCGSGPPEPDVLRGWSVPLRDRSHLGGATRGATVLLDGILGTGISGAPREPQAEAIREANGAGIPIVAVDGPSGADFTTGAVPGACIDARLTVALGYPKLGLLRFPARERCGDLLAVEIGFPPPTEPPGARAITGAWVARMLPRRAPDAHKGDAGYLTVVAGREGMCGAAVLAARAAVRGGAGIVRVVSAPGNRTILQSSVPEAIFVSWEDGPGVEDAVAWADALAVGPGLGRGEEPRALVERVLELRGDRPLVLDADGLNVFEGRAPELRDRLTGEAVVTPHPGELARLLGTSVEEIVDDPPARARESAGLLGCAVLLKGAPSVVAGNAGPLRISTTGGPELATGGTGDVLTGLTGAYLGAGLPAEDAASAALFVAGLAAQRAPHAVGHASSDLPGRLPPARGAVEESPSTGPPGILFASASPGGRRPERT